MLMAEGFRILAMDLHSHLLEKKVKPKDYWGQAKKMGLDAIAITEHADKDPKKAYFEAAKAKPKEMLLIPGMEMNTEAGHVLIYADSARLYDFPELQEWGVKLQKVLEISKAENFMVSIAHPWGFSYDSASYHLGGSKLAWFVRKNDIGVEAYDGMIGTLSEFIQDSKWLRRTLRFFDKVDRNRVASKMRINRLTNKLKKKLEHKSTEVINRCFLAMDLAKDAKFITAGSDAHYANRIGEGILKIRAPEKAVIGNAELLELIRNRENVVWAGPYVEESADGSLEKKTAPLKKKEIILGIKYAVGEAFIGNRKRKTLKKKLKTI